jgi:hypothetical protein
MVLTNIASPIVTILHAISPLEKQPTVCKNQVRMSASQAANHRATAWGDPPFDHRLAYGRNRRILLLAAYPGDGRFTQPTAAVQTWRPELVFMVESRCGAVAVARAYLFSAPFVWRCLTGSDVAPFPHPAHRTGHADRPHPALGQDLTPSPTTGRAQAGSDVRARSTRRDAGVDKSRLGVV